MVCLGRTEMRNCDWKEMLLWLIGRRRRFRVTGDSMLPLLAAGDEILLDPHVYRRRPPRIDEVVVARHPEQIDLQIVKRIVTVRQDGRCHLTGDNPDPTRNSASVVSPDLILGQVTSRFY